MTHFRKEKKIPLEAGGMVGAAKKRGPWSWNRPVGAGYATVFLMIINFAIDYCYVYRSRPPDDIQIFAPSLCQLPSQAQRSQERSSLPLDIATF